MKRNYDINQLLKPLPSEFKQFAELVSKLEYEINPDYKVKMNQNEQQVYKNNP